MSRQLMTHEHGRRPIRRLLTQVLQRTSMHGNAIAIGRVLCMCVRELYRKSPASKHGSELTAKTILLAPKLCSCAL